MADLVDVIEQTTDYLESLDLDLFIEYPNTAMNTNNDLASLKVFWSNLGAISTDAGNCYEVTEGIFSIQYLAPKSVPIMPIVAILEPIKKDFMTNIFDDVVISAGVINPIGEVGAWYVVQLDLTYQYEGYIDANNG